MSSRKKRFFTLCLLALAFAVMGACSANDPEEPITEYPQAEPPEPMESPEPITAGPPGQITAEAAFELMESGAPVILLDVREAHEFQNAHIPGARLIPLGELTDRAGAEIPDKDAQILIYCRSGRRSHEAAVLLVELGYTQVYDLGGIQSWPFETVSG